MSASYLFRYEYHYVSILQSVFIFYCYEELELRIV